MSDSTIALIERLKNASAFGPGIVTYDLFNAAATELTTLLERCEKAAAALELLQKRDKIERQHLGTTSGFGAPYKVNHEWGVVEDGEKKP